MGRSVGMILVAAACRPGELRPVVGIVLVLLLLSIAVISARDHRLASVPTPRGWTSHYGELLEPPRHWLRGSVLP